MKVTRVAAWAVIAASLAVGGLHAQALRNAQAPAEFPPASYQGTQYIDSNGCVFIRAGIDGNVTWVPRVNRQRQLICGQTPTLSANAAAAARATPRQSAQGTPEQISVTPPTAPAPEAPARATAAAPTPAPAPARTQATRAAPKSPTAAPRTTARTAAAPKPAPRTSTIVVKPVQPAPAPKPKVVAKPKSTAVPATRTARVQTRQPSCQGASPISSRYINSGQYGPVRCGPQTITRATTAAPRVVRPAPTVQPRTTVRRVPARTVTTQPRVSQQTRVVPRQVYDDRLANRAIRVPDGYEPVWEDDRLNPRRAEQSLEGIARTRLKWTNTVPRRLIDSRTGRDVTTTVPLVYPYTDLATQQRDLGSVTIVRRDGQLMKRVQRNTRAKAKARQPVVSTRSAPAPVVQPKTARAAPKKQTAATKGRYVQVGTFGVPSNAQAAAQRIARAGLPARIGKVKRGGKSYQIVLAGPFTSSSALSDGLKRSRAAGFRDAFVRK